MSVSATVNAEPLAFSAELREAVKAETGVAWEGLLIATLASLVGDVSGGLAIITFEVPASLCAKRIIRLQSVHVDISDGGTAAGNYARLRYLWRPSGNGNVTMDQTCLQNIYGAGAGPTLGLQGYTVKPFVEMCPPHETYDGGICDVIYTTINPTAAGGFNGGAVWYYKAKSGG